MHTFNGKSATFHHNSDLSGPVVIVIETSATSLEVAGEDLLAFVAEHVRRQRIASLEGSTPEQLLGLLP
jgi:hypothetical protein